MSEFSHHLQTCQEASGFKTSSCDLAAVHLAGDRHDRQALEKLKAQRQAKIEELKEKTNYYRNMQLIQECHHEPSHSMSQHIIEELQQGLLFVNIVKYDPDPAVKAAAASILVSKMHIESGLKPPSLQAASQPRSGGVDGSSSEASLSDANGQPLGVSGEDYGRQRGGGADSQSLRKRKGAGTLQGSGETGGSSGGSKQALLGSGGSAPHALRSYQGSSGPGENRPPGPGASRASKLGLGFGGGGGAGGGTIGSSGTSGILQEEEEEEEEGEEGEEGGEGGRGMPRRNSGGSGPGLQSWKGADGGGWVGRIAAMLVGEDPTQCYALICKRCHNHNGLATKEDFPYVTYYCPRCMHLNQGEHASRAAMQAPSAPPSPAPSPLLSSLKQPEANLPRGGQFRPGPMAAAPVPALSLQGDMKGESEGNGGGGTTSVDAPADDLKTVEENLREELAVKLLGVNTTGSEEQRIS
eukprot:jgi/Mesen1/10177/ME000076S09689